MSSQDSKVHAEEFLSIFRKGAEFSRELLKENERLRTELASVQDRQDDAARTPETWDKLRGELLARIRSLEEENHSMRDRLDLVERENNQFAQRYIEIEVGPDCEHCVQQLAQTTWTEVVDCRHGRQQ